RAVAGVDELEPEQDAAAAHLTDDRELADRRLELVAKRRAAVADALDEAVPDEHVQDRQADRARQRGAVPRVTVLELPRAVRERVVDVLRAERRRERGVARPEALP